MDVLFKNDVKVSLGLNRNINIISKNEHSINIELEEIKNSTKVNIKNIKEKEIFILDFEDFRNQLDNCNIIQRNGITKRCDYFLHIHNDSCILCEISSAKDEENLKKAIKDYPGGKQEKAQKQLLDSLILVKDLLPSVNREVEKCNRKICLFIYTLRNTEEFFSAEEAFVYKPAKAEPCLLLEHKEINDRGFKYVKALELFDLESVI